MKISVDKDKCISCGLCTNMCEKLFQLNDEGKSEVIKQPENEDEKTCAQNAIDTCPVQAINKE